MSLTWLEAVLIVLVLILITYIYFRGMHPMVEIRSNNGLPVDMLNVSSVEDLAKYLPGVSVIRNREYKPVYFPNGYVFRIDGKSTTDGNPKITIGG